MSTAKPVVKILPLILLVLIPIWFFINPKAETENNILNPIGEFVDSAQRALPSGKNVQTEKKPSKELENIIQDELNNSDGVYAIAIKNLKTN